MADSVDVPKVGKVDKKIIVPIVIAAAAFVGYRYWKARQDVGTGDEAVDPGYEDMMGGLGPGQTRPDNSYGLPDDTGSGTSTGGFRGTSNSEWSEYVTDRLQQDGRWSYSVIAVALGNFLSDRPLTSDQQDIVRAAIGIAGQPPVGYHTLIPGGNTPITVAPTGLVGTATPSTISVKFNPVPGATTYNGYRTNSTGSGNALATSPGSPLQFVGLAPGTSYSIQIAAVSSSGVVGPKSAPITVKTPAVQMATPAKPTVSNITASSAVATTKSVPYATAYKWFVNGKLLNTTTSPTFTITKMTSKRSYTVAVAAQSSGGTSPASAATSFRTK